MLFYAFILPKLVFFSFFLVVCFCFASCVLFTCHPHFTPKLHDVNKVVLYVFNYMYIVLMFIDVINILYYIIVLCSVRFRRNNGRKEIVPFSKWMIKMRSVMQAQLVHRRVFFQAVSLTRFSVRIQLHLKRFVNIRLITLLEAVNSYFFGFRYYGNLCARSSSLRLLTTNMCNEVVVAPLHEN